MEVYSNFSELFDAHVGLKYNMAVFNDYKAFCSKVKKVSGMSCVRDGNKLSFVFDNVGDLENAISYLKQFIDPTKHKQTINMSVASSTYRENNDRKHSNMPYNKLPQHMLSFEYCDGKLNLCHNGNINDRFSLTLVFPFSERFDSSDKLLDAVIDCLEPDADDLIALCGEGYESNPKAEDFQIRLKRYLSLYLGLLKSCKRHADFTMKVADEVKQYMQDKEE